MAGTIYYRFRLRRRTAASWTALNEILLGSEIGHESDTGRLKIGDGVTAWNALPYFAQTAGQTPYNNATSGLIATHVQGAIDEIAAGAGGGGGGDGYIFCESFLRGVQTSAASGTAFVTGEYRPVGYLVGSGGAIVGSPGAVMSASTVGGLVNLFVTQGLRLKPGFEKIRVGARLALPSLSNGINAFTFTFGLRSAITGVEANDVVASYTHGTNSGNWVLRSTEGGVATSTNSAAGPAAGVYTEIEIEIDATAANVTLYVDNIPVATHSTNVPTADMGLACLLYKSLGSGAVSAQVTRMWIR